MIKVDIKMQLVVLVAEAVVGSVTLATTAIQYFGRDSRPLTTDNRSLIFKCSKIH